MLIGKILETLKATGLDKNTIIVVLDLSIADRHIVEIARALLQNSKIIIMDEPTAALSKKDIDKLFKIIINLLNFF